jgi:hypothetical protein
LVNNGFMSCLLAACENNSFWAHAENGAKKFFELIKAKALTQRKGKLIN